MAGVDVVAGQAAGSIDAAVARRWMALALVGLEREREAIDSLNVYPVPDGDTGTNLHLTLRRACLEVELLPPDADVAAIAAAAATGALLGARGNSGIITSQLLRGWAEALHGRVEADPACVARAFVRADEQAWSAVETPVEGTILSVTRAASLAAQGVSGMHHPSGRELADLVTVVAQAARQALLETTSQLDVLAEAGVVDAGGAGLVVIIDALAQAVTGKQSRPLPDIGAGPVPLDQSCPSLAAPGPAFEVMFLLDAVAGDLPPMRRELARLGDSLVVVGGSGLWHVHVHVDDAGAAVEAGLRAGRPHRIRVTHLASGEPSAATADVAGSRAGTPPVPDPDQVGLVACAAGPGLAALFALAGAVPVLGEHGRRASTEEVLSAVRAAGTSCVVVLPNDTDTLAVARAAAQAARAEGLRVTVVPTRAQVQGLAAAAVHDPSADLDQDVALMSSAAGSTRHGAVTIAAREAITMAGRCRPGDVLGIVDGDFAIIGGDVEEVALQVLQRLLSGGGEIVTAVLGENAPDGLEQAIRNRLRADRTGTEVCVVDGGQPRYPLLLGVE